MHAETEQHQNWNNEAALSEQDEVQRFESGRRRKGEGWGDILFRHPSYYKGKKMDWTPAELAGCSDTELVSDMPAFTASREAVEA
jgi:hypothetical protein